MCHTCSTTRGLRPSPQAARGVSPPPPATERRTATPATRHRPTSPGPAFRHRTTTGGVTVTEPLTVEPVGTPDDPEQATPTHVEHGEPDRAEVATLRASVEALGGRLRVVADFGDAEYTVA